MEKKTFDDFELCEIILCTVNDTHASMASMPGGGWRLSAKGKICDIKKCIDEMIDGMNGIEVATC